MIFIFCINCKTNNNELDECKHLELVLSHLEFSNENPVTFVKDIKKIDLPIVKEFILSEFINDNNYDVIDYFENIKHEKVNCIFKFKTINLEEFEHLMVNSEKSKLKKGLRNENFIEVYLPVYNIKKTDFILLYREYDSNLHSNLYLNMYSIKNNKIMIVKNLLTSL